MQSGDGPAIKNAADLRKSLTHEIDDSREDKGNNESGRHKTEFDSQRADLNSVIQSPIREKRLQFRTRSRKHPTAINWIMLPKQEE